MRENLQNRFSERCGTEVRMDVYFNILLDINLAFLDIILLDAEEENHIQGSNGNQLVEKDAILMTDLMNPRDKSEEKENYVTTRDLICWSYQITRGMGHLESKKVHIIYL